MFYLEPFPEGANLYLSLKALPQIELPELRLANRKLNPSKTPPSTKPNLPPPTINTLSGPNLNPKPALSKKTPPPNPRCTSCISLNHKLELTARGASTAARLDRSNSRGRVWANPTSPLSKTVWETR